MELIRSASGGRRQAGMIRQLIRFRHAAAAGKTTAKPATTAKHYRPLYVILSATSSYNAILTFALRHDRTYLNMRPELVTPFDSSKFERVLPLTKAVYGLHQAGKQYAQELEELSLLAGRVVEELDVLGAFGSVGPGEFAKRLTIDWKTLPSDLSEPELLELVHAICEGRGSEVTIEYWIDALALNTGDNEISDLIFWPEQYLGNAYDGRELSPAEILDIALAKQR